MRFFNQSNKPLKWDMSGVEYVVEPFGPVEIPDDLVAACRSRGLPIDISPVPPMHKAEITVRAEAEAARTDEARLLREQIEEVTASFQSAKAEAERAKVDLGGREETIAKQRERIAELAEKLRIAEDDTRGANLKLEEMSRKVFALSDQSSKAQVSAKAAAIAAEDEKKAGNKGPPTGR